MKKRAARLAEKKEVNKEGPLSLSREETAATPPVKLALTLEPQWRSLGTNTDFPLSDSESCQTPTKHSPSKRKKLTKSKSREIPKVMSVIKEEVTLEEDDFMYNFDALMGPITHQPNPPKSARLKPRLRKKHKKDVE